MIENGRIDSQVETPCDRNSNSPKLNSVDKNDRDRDITFSDLGFCIFLYQHDAWMIISNAKVEIGTYGPGFEHFDVHWGHVK